MRGWLRARRQFSGGWRRIEDGFALSGDGGLWRVAGAGEDGEARIFGKGWIGPGKLAKEELGAFTRFDEAGVETIGAKAEARIAGAS